MGHLLDKQNQTFGSGTIKLLQSLRVGVIGCSGTGSIIIELLARNCVGNLVLVDNDRIELKNLNRIVNSKELDAKNNKPKVEVMKEAILAMGLPTKVETYEKLTNSKEVVSALIDCDAVFGCVDSHSGRFHLDCIASAYCIPYFDIGVFLEVDKNSNDIIAADAAAHYMHPEGVSLFERRAYDMGQVGAELIKIRESGPNEGNNIPQYLAPVGEDQPAVMSINMQAACMGFNDFLARFHADFESGSSKFRHDNHKIDHQLFRIAHSHYQTKQGDEFNQGPAGYINYIKNYRCTGDFSTLVRNNHRCDD